MKGFHFPKLLAGPIIRRVEPTQVCMWVATSDCYSIHAQLYQIRIKGIDTDYLDIETQCVTDTIQLGEKLYVHMIQVTPAKGKFPMNQLMGYNLLFSKDADAFDLKELGLLSQGDSRSIVYGNLQYPSFYISSSEHNRHFLYGSCRKLHGEGKDTLPIGDHILEKAHIHIEDRPSTLFLMGDQIYADNVADSLIRIISKIGHELIGHKEELHRLDRRLEHEPFTTSINQINGRSFIMNSFCKFTSSSADNHLIELGEYAVMYLLSWSPQLWELIQEYDMVESFDEAIHNNHVYFYFSERDTKQHEAEKSQLLARYNKQQSNITTFQQSIYQVRRLLANIPTYMIFDDHDLTDDWNISFDWREGVRQSPLGKHVIANGLTAYWAFQGWGNHPTSFDSEFTSTIKKYFESLMNGDMYKYHDQWTELLWSYNQWHFIAPTNPKAVFLDTRTQRKFDYHPKPIKIGSSLDQTHSAPQLMNKDGWKRITKLLTDSGWVSNSPLIIVSATPVYGMGLIENALLKYANPLKIVGVHVNTKFDFEAWKYNAEGFTSFLDQVSRWNPSPCMIVSGDVHYGSSVYAKVQFYDGRRLDIRQFTSSPLNNMSFTSVWGNLLKGAVWVNSIERKNDIYRYCDPTYHIKHIDLDQFSKVDYIWKDQLRYQSVNNKAIIQMNNNLGLLSLCDDRIDNQLLNGSIRSGA